MADFKLYFPKLLVYEGGYTNNPADKGGPTKYGITLEDWIKYGSDLNGDGEIDKDDVKLITVDEAMKIAKGEYWDLIKADDIDNQSVAEMIVDWAYTSGVITAITRVQTLLGVHSDGLVGPETLKAINTSPQINLFTLLKGMRIAYYRGIVARHPSQEVFLKGWLNRVDQFTFIPNDK